MRPLSFLSEGVDQFGVKEIERLCQHYGEDKTGNANGVQTTSKAVVDKGQCLQEWTLAKKLVLQQQYPRDSLATLWQILRQNHSDSFPNLFILAKLALIVPLQSADCERGFSVQNNIHTSARNRLAHTKLNQLMTVMIAGPSIEDFEPKDSVSVWKTANKRRIFNR